MLVVPTNVLKYKYILVLSGLFLWVYFVPMTLGNIEELGLASSTEYFGSNGKGRYRIFSMSTTKHNKNLDQYHSTVLYIDSLQEIPQPFLTCLFNEEDNTFFSNPGGINLKGLGRALAGGTGGGSGICQQMVKNVFFTTDSRTTNNIKNLNRKLAEILLTINFTRNYSREDILRTYLNNFYVGTDNKQYGSLYGLKVAAQYHFNKPLDKLTFGECAILVKYVNKPEITTSKRHLAKLLQSKNRKGHQFEKDYVSGKIDERTYKTEVSRYRRKRVLSKLLKAEKITSEQFRQFNNEPIHLVDNFRLLDEDDRLQSEKGFVRLVDAEKEKILRNLGWDEGQGLKIYTTINLRLQNSIQSIYAAINKNWQDSVRIRYKTEGRDTIVTDNLQCAAFCIDKHSGAVLGLLHGRVDDNNNWINYCFVNRQSGSIFKLFDYYTLFQQNPSLHAGSLVPDMKLGNYNYPRSHTKNKYITIRSAVSYSSNIVPYNLIYEGYITLDQLLRVASLFNINISTPDMGTLIGQNEVSLAKMVNAYNTISNEGFIKENFYILKITDRSGKILYERADDTKQMRDLNAAACVKLKQCFNGVINTGGTASFISRNKFVNSANSNFGGKTGTTNNATNLWYIGYTPDFTLGIWQGYSATNIKEAGTSGSDCALLWSQIISKYYGN